jgi:hypothetical protein
MTWFERQLNGRSTDEVELEHGRLLRAAGVDRALAALSGSYGVRRYVVRFGESGGQVRVSLVDTVPLSCGGGPPLRDPAGAKITKLERALTALHRNMSTNSAWETGAIAVLRNAEGDTDLLPLFDEDAADSLLVDLPNPGPPGHPLETPAYHRLVAEHEAQVAAVHGETARLGRTWTEWAVSEDDQSLELVFESGPRKYRCQTLGTFEPAKSWFEWEVEEPLFPDDVFSWAGFLADLDPCIELGMLATARLGAAWLFVQSFDADGSVVLVAVWA